MSRQVAARGRVPSVPDVGVSAKKKTAKLPRPPCLLHQYRCTAKQSVLAKYQPYCASHGRRIKGWSQKPDWKRIARKKDLQRYGSFVEPPAAIGADKRKH